MHKSTTVIATFALLTGIAQGKSLEPSQRTFTAAVQHYLRDRGDLCLGKFNWPIDITDQDRQAGAADAIQMPVLERLGLVSSSMLSPAVIRYDLTDTGKKFYLQKTMTGLGRHEPPASHRGDFCVAKLSLDKVVSWEPATVDGRQQTTVTYTYKIAAADWTRDPEFQRVFPRVKLVVEGAGKLELKESFRLAGQNWTPFP